MDILKMSKPGLTITLDLNLKDAIKAIFTGQFHVTAQEITTISARYQPTLTQNCKTRLVDLHIELTLIKPLYHPTGRCGPLKHRSFQWHHTGGWFRDRGHILVQVPVSTPLYHEILYADCSGY